MLIYKLILLFCAWLSLFLGILGIFLPLLPTTPFLLLSASLFFKSSPKLYHWIINHPYFGDTIKNYQQNKSISKASKQKIIIIIWLFFVLSSLTLWCQQMPIYWFIIIFIINLAVSLFIYFIIKTID